MGVSPHSVWFALLAASAPVQAGTYFEFHGLDSDLSITDGGPAGAPFTGSWRADAEPGGQGYAFALGYLVADRVGVEVSARRFGALEGEASSACVFTRGPVCLTTLGRASVHGVAGGRALSIVARQPLGSAWALTGRVGVQQWHARASFRAAGLTIRMRDQGTGSLYGLGLEWQFHEDASLTFGLEDHEISDTTPQVGFRLRF